MTDSQTYLLYKGKNVKWSRYRPVVAKRVGRGIALLFHYRGTTRGWVVSSTPRPHFTPGKDPVPILQEAGWAPGPVWTGGKSRPHRDSIPDSPARSQSLYRLSYPAYILVIYSIHNNMYISPTSVFKLLSVNSHSGLVSLIEMEIGMIWILKWSVNVGYVEMRRQSKLHALDKHYLSRWKMLQFSQIH